MAQLLECRRCKGRKPREGSRAGMCEECFRGRLRATSRETLEHVVHLAYPKLYGVAAIEARNALGIAAACNGVSETPALGGAT